MAWLQLIRWRNLVIIFLTQLLAWACVIIPSRHFEAVPYLLGPVYFLLLALSTVLIAAAGYIINDYFDIKIDAINRPGKVVLEKQIPRRKAIIAHTLINIIALVLAGIVARRAGHYEWLALQLCCTLLLWFYSTDFKRQFMSGNVIVAILTALTIITLILYEPAMHHYIGRFYFLFGNGKKFVNPVWVLGVYAYFAFTLTWMREIVKDMEDYKGDAEQGCVTMPIKWGLKRSAQLTQLLGVAAVIPLLVASYKLCMAKWWFMGLYTFIALAIPIIIWILFLQRRATTQHYHAASRWLKIIMVSGVGSLIIYYFQSHA
ncbi:MAG: geranylgeranylglycerol-phosphate geranylgeranyltransferase [Bacteroidetes bacterium]|nr:geranylgeranylglycerol-phosphate geranylgeranyltransferase [Bacteroidota bacterium]